MEQRRYCQGAQHALVLLPGAQMHPADVEQAGLPALLRHSGVALDLVVPDLHLDPTGRSDACARLAQEVLAPLATRYRRLWLAGISLGGLLALNLVADHPGEIDGLCLIAPYPGSRLTTNAIARAGGLAAWQPTAEELRDPECRVYRWLKAPPADLPVFVGHGRDDRFAAGMQAIADCFPASARQLVAGDHDWPAWRDLWEHFLDRRLFNA